MREKNTIIVCATVCVTLIICGIIFWPTLFRYDKIKFGESTLPFRVNRITGYTEILYLDGWKIVSYVINEMPIDEINKITINGDFDGKGNYKFSVYNASNWTINKIRFSIWLNINQKLIWQRIYETPINILPFSKQSSSIELMDNAPKTIFFEHIDLDAMKPGQVRYLGEAGPGVKLEKAFGYKGHTH